MATLNAWDVTDANNNATPPDGWPENTMQYSEVNNTGRAMQGTMKRFFADINGSLSAAGAANAYTITLNESGYNAYFTGMYFVCRMPATNTGASTINVNGIGVQTITDRAGGALTAGEIQQDGIYEFRYDGTNFQLMGTVTGTAILPSGVLTNSNNPDLVDTDVALNVGAADPSAAQHIEVGPSAIQSKSDGTTAAALSLNSLGGTTNLGAQSGTGGVFAYHDGNIRANTAAGAFIVRSDGNTDTESRRVIFDHQDSTARGSVGYISSDSLRIQNLIHGGNVELESEDSGGTLRNILVGDPDGVTQIYYNGTETFRTQGLGIVQIRGDQSVDNDTRFLEYAYADGTRRAFMGHISSGGGALEIRNEVHGATVILEGEDGSGTVRNILLGDPDNQTILYYNGTARFITESAGSVSVRSDGNTDTEVREIQFDYADGTARAFVGHSGSDSFRVRNLIHGGAVTIQGENTGGTLTNMVIADPDAQTDIYHAGLLALRTTVAGIDIRDTSGDDPELILRDDAGNALGMVRSVGTSRTELFAFEHGTNIVLTAEDAGGTARTLFDGDPDGSVTLYNDGTARILTRTLGRFDIRSDGNTDAEDRGIIFSHQNGTQRAFIGNSSNTSLTIAGQIHGGNIVITAEDAGGTSRNILIGDPDSDVKLYHVGTEVARTLTAANGGMEVNNTDTGGGFERVLTESDNVITVAAAATSDLSRSSTATVTQDNDLTVTVPETGYYSVEVGLPYGSGVGGIRVVINGDAGTAGTPTYKIDNEVEIGTSSSVTTRNTTEGVFSTAITNGIILIRGNIEINTLGDVWLEWAQEVSNAADTTRREGSYIRLTKQGS